MRKITGSNIEDEVENLVFPNPQNELIIMVSNDDKFTGPIKTGALRKQQAAVIQLPVVPGTINSIYLFFGSDKRKLYSPDMYFSGFDLYKISY